MLASACWQDRVRVGFSSHPTPEPSPSAGLTRGVAGLRSPTQPVEDRSCVCSSTWPEDSKSNAATSPGLGSRWRNNGRICLAKLVSCLHLTWSPLQCHVCDRQALRTPSGCTKTPGTGLTKTIERLYENLRNPRLTKGRRHGGYDGARKLVRGPHGRATGAGSRSRYGCQIPHRRVPFQDEDARSPKEIADHQPVRSDRRPGLPRRGVEVSVVPMINQSLIWTTPRLGVTGTI